MKTYNDILIKTEGLNSDLCKGIYILIDSKVRFTFVDKNGNVIKDTENKSFENHLDREEIKNAFEDRRSISTRYSDTQGVNVVYYATKVK